MRAAAWTSDGTLETIEREAPAERPGHVLVRPAVVGICGSDLHFFRGDFPAAPGTTPGHEIAGWVERGEGFERGTPVAIEPTISCGRCAGCRRGQAPACQRLRLMGISAPGGMQDLLVAPVENVHRLPAGTGPAIGALAEPLAVCVRAMNRAQAPLGSRVLVLGSGTIGLLALLLARDLSEEVAVTARYPHQAELARVLGASRVFEPGSAALLEWARANPVDLVIETVGGAAPTLGEAVGAVQPGGTVVALGVFTADVAIPARKLVNQELRLIGSVVYGHEGHQSEFGAAVALLPRFADELALLKTAAYPLEQANAAFEHAADKRRAAVKISVLVEHGA